jgi:hypothetical protein
MVIALHIAIVILLILVTYQDFKFRAVSWIIFPLLLIVIATENFINDHSQITAVDVGVNVIFILVQVIFLTLYLSVRQRRLVKVWDAYIGPGDILFFLVLAFYFTPFNFIGFYILSLLFTVLVVGIVGRFSPRLQQVPLAGIQSALLLMLLGGNLAFDFMNFKSDYFILSLL